MRSRWCAEPGFDYGRVLPEWSLAPDRHRADATGAGQTMRLQTDMLLGIEANDVRARHVLRDGEELFCAVSWDEHAPTPTTVEEAEALLLATTRFWRHWLSRARIPDHEFRALIQRSALAIKGLTYMPTGATVAALTTSLPETPRGERNWDYRYTWIRDSTFTLQALHYLDLDWEADEFMQFIADLSETTTVACRSCTGSTVVAISPRRSVRIFRATTVPARSGSETARLTSARTTCFGAALDSVLLHTRRSQRLPRRLWPLIQAQAECAKAVWRKPDQGIWEARGKPQHYVSSKLMCWVAMGEQRRILALDAESKPLVLTAIDALTIAPERFTPETGIYLGLRSIYHDLENAKSDDSLREVVTRLWDMAVQLEDGNVSQAEQALRQAQEALRQALERGASEEEIKKLMEQLRAAMDKFLQALAEELRKNPQQLARPLDRNDRTLSQQDLKSMLDRLEQMARSGNKDAARQLLDQLQSMLENLQMARPGASGGDDGDDDMMSALDELSDMIRKQQQLRDKTFRQGQDMRRDRQRGQPGQGDRQMGDLRQDQQGLRDRLNKLLDQLRQRGLGQPGQQNGGSEMDQLGEAGESMGQAEGQLGQGDADNAVDSQAHALDAMRKGAQGLAQSMQQQGMGPGPNGRSGRGQARAQQETDPLGRPMRGRDYGDDITVKVPGEIDAQRARRILEELRKRFGESFRPQLELDYIERLLKDF